MDESIRSKRHQLSGQRPKSCARSIIFDERPHFRKEIGVRFKIFVLQPALLGSKEVYGLEAWPPAPVV